MEGGAAEKEQQQGASYTYWVRKITDDAVPMPVPRKLAPEDGLSGQPRTNTFGSVWNRAGTWEEKSLNNWATERMKELIMSAFMVIVRNKKRVGYTYELTLKVKGEWMVQDDKKLVNGHIDVPEFSVGELDDLKFEVRLSEVPDLLHRDKIQIKEDLKLFLKPVREKLVQFEQELKDR